jgi:Flp pilus assembly protein TadG
MNARKPQLPHRQPRSNRRAGLAVVELAVCLPVLVMLLLGTLEACRMIQLKQDLSITAYEGARIGIIPGASSYAVQTQCEMLLDDRNVRSYEVAIDPDPSLLDVGDLFTVTVTADCVDNSVVGGVFFQGKTISESVVMRAE